MEQIAQVSTQIKDLEAAQKKYEDMLSRAVKLKESLECNYDKSQKVYQNQIITDLKSLYNITSDEG